MAIKPVITLVGRPNVGKSTLFNCLTRSRDALVADLPGLTRDRLYGKGKVGDRPYIVIDTGGLTDGKDIIAELVSEQAFVAMEEADVILFMVDGISGLTIADERIASRLRRLNKRVFLVVNKIEGRDVNMISMDFHVLGLGSPYAVSAAHSQGVGELMEAVLHELPAVTPDIEDPQGIYIAVVGSPNTGKSTLVNRILGTARVMVQDQAGTTRDSVYIPYERDGQQYIIIDTAGIRRRGRVADVIEKFSIVKTLQAVDAAHVVILMVDAREGIRHQDLSLAGMVLERGRAVVIAINKWDGLTVEQRRHAKSGIDRRLSFLDFARTYFISALHGTGVGDLFDGIQHAYQCTTRKFTTPQLMRILQEAVLRNPPPLARGRRIRLRYAHQGGINPPVIIIHGNQTDRVPDAYRRYLTNSFRKILKLEGTPLRIEFKTSTNPYISRTKASHKH